MIIELFEDLIDCLKKQEESLISFNAEQFEQSCLELFSIEKKLRPLMEEYIRSDSPALTESMSHLKLLQQKIRNQRSKNDLLFKKLEQYFDVVHDNYKYESQNQYVYSKDLFLKRS